MTERKNEQNTLLNGIKTEKAVLIGLYDRNLPEDQITEYLDELAFLAETAGAVTVKRFIQRLPNPDPSFYIGKGKANEIATFIKENGIRLAIFDDDLNGTQIHNLEKLFGCRVLDRSHLILDIFALRARTSQAKAQVELAQMQYLLPRLKGMWTHLERQRGGIGLRGPGEKEIETDRRVVKDKIARLKEQLRKIDRQNSTMRKNRNKMIRVSLVGYTNVGKSTIMNLLSKSDVFAENKLFATLDATVRKVVIDRVPFLLTDTVGFIRKLPHHLVESFKSTLDEVRESDILLHVIDLSHPYYEDQIGVVQQTLKEIGAVDKPVIMVFNKLDLYREKYFDALVPGHVKSEILQGILDEWQTKTGNECILVSAATEENIDGLKAMILKHVKAAYHARYPYKSEFY